MFVDSARPILRVIPAGGLLRPALISIVTVVVLGLFSPSWPVATLILIYAMAALGCNLLLGYTGLLSVGQSVYFGVGGYVAGIAATRWGLQLSSALVLAAVLCAVAASLIGFLAIRRVGIYFVMITFAFAELAYFLVFVFQDYTGGENGLLGFPLASFGAFGQSFFIADQGAPFYYMMAVLFVLLFVALQRFVDSPVGTVLVAIRENESRAAAMGYSVKSYKLLAFMVSGAVTGVAGCLYAFFVGSASVSGIEIDMSITIVIITVLGGIRSLYGSFLGAVAYVALNTYLANLWPYWQMLLGLALIGIVLFFKGGLQGAFLALINLLLRGTGKKPGPPEEQAEKEMRSDVVS